MKDATDADRALFDAAAELELTTARCADCGAYDEWQRPDGSKICGGCVKRAGTRGGDS